MTLLLLAFLKESHANFHMRKFPSGELKKKKSRIMSDEPVFMALSTGTMMYPY